ncbi:MAG: GNAT family N-acetyltransferase [Candidatus Gastranaerophilales bacterium]|nr:GNAT family N-acetyltransferase [Candidatus Gastranaerophilales bacterium]
MEIRPYKSDDADIILSWCKDEKAFYQWTAGVIGDYPVTEKEFKFVESLNAFTALDKTEIIGFFTLRQPDKSKNELRLGFVIVNPGKRGKGFGKQMIKEGLKYAFEILGAKKVSLGVFENNLPAYYCYKSVGFKDVVLKETESYQIFGEEWKCKELSIENPNI